MAKAANTYIHMISYFFVFNEFANKLFHFLITGFCLERKGGGLVESILGKVKCCESR